jgi:hypothetical protein
VDSANTVQSPAPTSNQQHIATTGASDTPLLPHVPFELPGLIPKPSNMTAIPLQIAMQLGEHPKVYDMVHVSECQSALLKHRIAHQFTQSEVRKHMNALSVNDGLFHQRGHGSGPILSPWLDWKTAPTSLKLKLYNRVTLPQSENENPAHSKQ